MGTRRRSNSRYRDAVRVSSFRASTTQSGWTSGWENCASSAASGCRSRARRRSRLPFRDEAFDCVISSQVIEHISYEESIFTEMWRVLTPGGTLIIGTPDYSTRGWRMIEPIYGHLIPGGYRDEHITHYTREGLGRILLQRGFVAEADDYILGSELIMRWRKPAVVMKPPVGAGSPCCHSLHGFSRARFMRRRIHRSPAQAIRQQSRLR